jgi:hypothetical protein
MTAQHDMFPASPVADDGLVGLAITLPEACPRCSGHDAVIGAGRGPHKASIMCVCGRHLGWMSITTFNFINAISTVWPAYRANLREPPTDDGGSKVAHHH